MSESLKLAVTQRVCPGYRVALFKELTSTTEMDVRLFIGNDVPNSKVKNAPSLEDIKLTRLNTRFIKLIGRVLPWHTNLVSELKKFNPDIILCEADSHFLGYMQAIYYKFRFNRRVGLLHWCFISLPGRPKEPSPIRGAIKKITRNFFDAFVVYSSFSKNALVQKGFGEDRIFVATNVGDTNKFLKLNDSITVSKSEARQQLGLPDKFTAIYLGTLDPNKRPEVFLELAEKHDNENYNYILLGAGPMLEPLRKRQSDNRLESVYLPGRVVEDLPLYLRAADVLLIPGRGGIVISEAMAFGIPVIVHEADGTEYDLVIPGETGEILKDGDSSSFYQALEDLRNDSPRYARISQNCHELVSKKHTSKNMVEQIKNAVKYVARLKS